MQNLLFSKKNNFIINSLNSSLLNLPTPSSISILWNFGSLMGFILIMQIFTGLMLTFYYTPDITLAFSSIMMMNRNIPNMWLIQITHMNGASLFFILIYLHISRNIYYNSFKNHMAWYSGVLILMLLMITAFLGYVLPWGQMSFWGATVITNLLSVIPYMGSDIVSWLWGGFSVENPTLKRFFSLHYLIPLIISFLTIIHMIFLHQSGSSNPSGLNSNLDKIQFHPLFSLKDLMSLSVLMLCFMTMILINPFLLLDPENFNLANPMTTPTHIQPEWYFLFAYAILRSIPNKLGGVIALLMSILILLLPPMMKLPKISTMKFSVKKKILFWNFMNTLIILTWIGANPVELPFIMIGQIFTFLYFSFFLIMMMVST